MTRTKITLMENQMRMLQSDVNQTHAQNAKIKEEITNIRQLVDVHYNDVNMMEKRLTKKFVEMGDLPHEPKIRDYHRNNYPYH